MTQDAASFIVKPKKAAFQQKACDENKCTPPVSER